MIAGSPVQCLLAAMHMRTHTGYQLQDKDIQAKFLGATEAVLGSDRAAAALRHWWDLRTIPDVSAALDLLDVATSRQ